MRKHFKKVLAYILSVVFLGSVLSTFCSMESSANYTIYKNEADAAVAWAESLLGSSQFPDGRSVHYECIRFVYLAYVDGAGFADNGYGNARTWGNLYTKSTNLDEIPPKGALCFFDWWGTVNGVYQNWGHVGISTGDGYIIHATDKVYKSDYKLSNYSGMTYTGWGTYRGYDLEYTVDTPETGAGQTIFDGSYQIITAVDESMALDVAGDTYNVANGTNIQIAHNIKNKYDVFNVTYTDDGYYMIRHQGSNRSLDVAGGETAAGTNIQLYENNDTASQRWSIIPAGDDWYYIQSKVSGLYLDVDGGNATDGTNVHQWTGNESIAQKWKFVKFTDDVGFNLPVTGMQMNTSTATGEPGMAITLEVNFMPSNASNRNVNWSSSDTSVAVVKGIGNESGIVTFLSPGTCVITAASAEKSDITTSCTVTVTGTDGGGGNSSGGDSSGGNSSGGNSSGENVPVAAQLFSDVSANAWYVNAVQYVYDNNIMSGTTSTTFLPEDTLTREQFTQVLYNHMGKPSTGGISNPFSDVQNAWYTNSVLWAKSNNIANGKSSTVFGVGQNITREELALMLYRYAKLKGFNTMADVSSIEPFADTANVSNWARGAMNWAVTHGIMSGKGSGGNLSTYRLDPQGNATRAECASMMKKLLTMGQ